MSVEARMALKHPNDIHWYRFASIFVMSCGDCAASTPGNSSQLFTRLKSSSSAPSPGVSRSACSVLLA